MSIKEAWYDLTFNMDRFRRLRGKWLMLKMNIRRVRRLRSTRPSFWKSLCAFLSLSKAGFRISYSKSEVVDLVIHRFWWNEKVIELTGDIDKIGDHYVCLFDGKTEQLSHREVDKLKENLWKGEMYGFRRKDPRTR